MASSRAALSEWLLGPASALFTARGICILGVVMIHFTGGHLGDDPGAEQTGTRLLYLGVNQWFQFVVPCFVFLSGYALAGRTVAWPGGILPFYRRRAAALLGAYACFALVYLAYDAPATEISGKASSLGRLLGWVGYYGMDTHAYFVPLILQLYLLHPMLGAWSAAVDRAAGRRRFAIEWSVLGGALALHLALSWMVWGAGGLTLRDVRPFGPFYLVHFCLGIRWRSWAIRLERRRALPLALALVGLAAQVLAWGQGMGVLAGAMPAEQMALIQFACCHPRAVIQAVGMCLVCGAVLVARPKMRLPLVQSWGSHSLGIFLWHDIVLWAWVLGIPNPFASVPASAAALWVPVAVCTLISGAALVLRSALARMHR